MSEPARRKRPAPAAATAAPQRTRAATAAAAGASPAALGRTAPTAVDGPARAVFARRADAKRKRGAAPALRGAGDADADDDAVEASASEASSEEESKPLRKRSKLGDSADPPAAAPAASAGPRPTGSVDLPRSKPRDYIRRAAALASDDDEEATTLTAATARIAAHHGLKLQHLPMRGFRAEAGTAADSTTKLATASFVGHRRRQVLHEHAEVMRWHLENPPEGSDDDDDRESGSDSGSGSGSDDDDDDAPVKLKPVEVQSMYRRTAAAPARRARGAGASSSAAAAALSLTITANQPESQAALAAMSAADVRAAYQRAAALPKPKRGGGPPARSAALRILHAGKLMARRRADSDNASAEDAADMADALRLAAMAAAGQHTVVLNDSGTHAEQSLDAHDRARGAGGVRTGEADVAGTLIRCGACTAALGPDAVATAIHNHSEPRPRGASHPHTAGLLYPREMTPAQLEATAPEMAAGRIRIDAAAARRPRARSPTPEPSSDDDSD